MADRIRRRSQQTRWREVFIKIKRWREAEKVQEGEDNQEEPVPVKSDSRDMRRPTADRTVRRTLGDVDGAPGQEVTGKYRDDEYSSETRRSQNDKTSPGMQQWHKERSSRRGNRVSRD